MDESYRDELPPAYTSDGKPNVTRDHYASARTLWHKLNGTFSEPISDFS